MRQVTLSRTTDAEKEERRARIVRGGASEFARRGFEHSSIEELSRAGGISRRTFYKYFESKKALFLAIVDYYFQGSLQVLEGGRSSLRAAAEAGAEPEQMLCAWRGLVLGVLKFNAENREMGVLVYGEAQGEDEHFNERVAELLGRSRDVLVEAFASMQKSGAMIPFDPGFVADLVNGALIGALLDYILSSADVDVAGLADNIVRYQARALLADWSMADLALDGKADKPAPGWQPQAG